MRASREVIVSAGAFQSPQLLMLSGIGDADALTRLGIPVVEHAPRVGHSLKDHVDFIIAYQSPRTDLMGLAPGV